MKKFLLSILSIFFCLGTLTGGALLLSGCDSSSYSENNPTEENPGEGIFDDENGDVDITPPSEDGIIDDDDEVSAMAHSFQVIAQFRRSSTSMVTASTSLSSSYPQEAFSVTWTDGSNTVDWGNAPTVNSGGSTTTGAASVNASYFSYSYDGGWFTPNRTARIQASAGGGYIPMGMSTSSSFTTSSYTSPNYQTYYFGNSGTLSTSNVTATQNVTGTVYVKFRRTYTITYYYWFDSSRPGTYGDSNSAHTATIYAGVSSSMWTPPIFTGYVFEGWSTTRNGTSVINSITAANANSNRTYYAVYAKSFVTMPYYTTNFSSISVGSNESGTYGGSITSTYYTADGRQTTTLDIGTFVLFNTNITVTANARSGYVFYGWYSETPTRSNYETARISDELSMTFSTSSGTLDRYALFVRSYTLTINYYSRSASTSTNLSISAEDGRLSASTVSLGNSVTFQSYGTSLTFPITIEPTASINYYLGTSSSATSESMLTYNYYANASRKINIYVVQRYSVTFDGNGFTGFTGSEMMLPTYKRHGESVNLNANTFIRTGYDFAGWATSPTGGVVYKDEDLYTANANEVLYAVWELATYQITYNSNYPSGTDETYVQTKTHGTNVSILSLSSCGFSKPTGYTFEGWATSASSSTVRYSAGATYSTNADEDLYAVWERITYTIRFYPNYPTSTSAGTAVRRTKTYGVSFTINSASSYGFSCTGYTFSRWTTGESGTGTSYYTGSSYTANASLTLYAQWTRATYTNYYRYRTTSGSDTTYTTQTRTYGSSFNALTTSSVSEYVSNGWTLAGWATASNTTSNLYDPGESISAYTTNTSTVTFYAVSERTVSITYDANNGSFSTTPTTTGTQLWNQYGNVYSNPSLTVTSTTPTRGGYTFLGWSTNQDATSATYAGGARYTFSRGYNLSASVTFYAVWRENNPAYYDDAGDYWYVELGAMPQSRVEDSEVIDGINASSTVGATYFIADMALTATIYNGEEYCEYNGNWYRVEPIRWRLDYSTSQTVGFGTTTDTLAIMDTIVFVSQFSETELNVGDGYSDTAVTGLLESFADLAYFVTETKSMPTFGTTSLNGTTESVTSNIFVASREEITEVAGGGKIQFSDLVKDYLIENGQLPLYYTRDLGKNYNNIFCMNGNGESVQYKPQNYFGVQFSVLITEYACV